MIRSFALTMLVMTAFSLPVQAAGKTPSPISLVVMIEGETKSGTPVAGAGLVIGATPEGEALIVTARHVLQNGDSENIFTVSFFEDPSTVVPARIEKKDFGKDLDLAVIAAPLPAGLAELDFEGGLPIGRLDEEFTEGEAASLIGQTDNQSWSVTTGNTKITVDQGETVQVLTFEAGPGSSGGIALDSSDRIVGISLSDDGDAISVLKLSVIETQLKGAGIVFSITAGAARDLIPESEYEPMIRRLLTSSPPDLITNIAPNARAVAAVNGLLDEDRTLQAFAAKFRSEEALEWMANLIISGFDPNRLVIVGERRRERSLLYPVLRANNIALAKTLLDNGASPYVYEELWGQEYYNPLLLFPLEWLEIVSATAEEKASLVSAMIAAGLTVPNKREKSEYVDTSQQLEGVAKSIKQVAASYEIAVPLENSIRDATSGVICERFGRRDGYDWCKEVAALPVTLKGPSDGWRDEFRQADLVTLLSVTNQTMQVLTYSQNCCWTDAQYGLMEITKGAGRIVWYRYIGSGYGLGHCEELRRVPEWKPDYGVTTTCWRRQDMVLDGDGRYSVQGYDSVRYVATY